MTSIVPKEQSSDSKKDISTACKISEVTISKCYKKLAKYKNFLLDKNLD